MIDRARCCRAPRPAVALVGRSDVSYVRETKPAIYLVVGGAEPNAYVHVVILVVASYVREPKPTVHSVVGGAEPNAYVCVVLLVVVL